MKRLTTLILGIGLLAAACGTNGAGSLGSTPSASPSPTQTTPSSPSPTPSRTPSPSGRKLTYQVWFLAHGQLFVTKRTEPFALTVAGIALNGLLAGPNPAESAAGVTTAIGTGLSGRITAHVGDKATVDLDPRFFQETTSIVRLRQAQVVYTLTQYSTIGKVLFTSNGQAQGTLAWARKDFDDLLPAILVESPVIGQRVPNPVTVSGTANVFEATVSLRILDENGKVVTNTFTTATCGTGCRGDYSVSVHYSVDHQQPGTIEVYESSAKDGSAINVVDIPVTLTP
jgi:hypothetical protein